VRSPKNQFVTRQPVGKERMGRLLVALLPR
jgi:hypothetical protein